MPTTIFVSTKATCHLSISASTATYFFLPAVRPATICTRAAASTTTTAAVTGVAECDEFIQKYEACVNSKVPETARSMVKANLDSMRNAWKQAAATPQGKAGLANAREAYMRFKEIFLGERFARLRDAGCPVQRPLWASTGTKNPAYSDVLYIEGLIAADTINTMPPKTIEDIRLADAVDCFRTHD